MDSNNISIGIHYFKVLVQIHYSRSPGGQGRYFGLDGALYLPKIVPAEEITGRNS